MTEMETTVEVAALEPVTGLKELTEVAMAAIDLANVGLLIAKDGKVDVNDLPVVFAVIPLLAASIPLAMSGITLVPGELKDLDSEEAVALIGLVMVKLQVGEGKARLIVAASLKAGLANYQLVKEILA